MFDKSLLRTASMLAFSWCLLAHTAYANDPYEVEAQELLDQADKEAQELLDNSNTQTDAATTAAAVDNRVLPPIIELTPAEIEYKFGDRSGYQQVVFQQDPSRPDQYHMFITDITGSKKDPGNYSTDHILSLRSRAAAAISNNGVSAATIVTGPVPTTTTNPGNIAPAPSKSTAATGTSATTTPARSSNPWFTANTNFNKQKSATQVASSNSGVHVATKTPAPATPTPPNPLPSLTPNAVPATTPAPAPTVTPTAVPTTTPAPSVPTVPSASPAPTTTSLKELTLTPAEIAKMYPNSHTVKSIVFEENPATPGYYTQKVTYKTGRKTEASVKANTIAHIERVRAAASNTPTAVPTPTPAPAPTTTPPSSSTSTAATGTSTTATPTTTVPPAAPITGAQTLFGQLFSYLFGTSSSTNVTPATTVPTAAPTTTVPPVAPVLTAAPATTVPTAAPATTVPQQQSYNAGNQHYDSGTKPEPQSSNDDNRDYDFGAQPEPETESANAGNNDNSPLAGTSDSTTNQQASPKAHHIRATLPKGAAEANKQLSAPLDLYNHALIGEEE